MRESPRTSDGMEELTFSNLWDGDADATVTIAQDGAAIFTGLTGEGVKTWTIDRNGRYELTHTTYTNGAPGKVETAVFVVEGKEVPVGELTIDWGQSSFVYDGQPKEPVVAVKDGATTLTNGTHYLVEYKDNVKVGTARAIVKGIEPYVGEVTNTFTIVKGTLPPGEDHDPLPPGVDPDDPGQREDPDVRFSAFDYVGMYDGAYHTIDTNALKQAWTAALGAVTLGYSTASNGTYQSNAFALNDVGVTSFWYKVTSANYSDIVKPCKVAITNRCVTLTSGTKLDFTYDGKPHAFTNLSVTAGSFVVGEGIATSNWATVTVVAEGQVPNAFDYAPLAGTKLSNYDLTVVTGKIAVVKGDLPPGDDPDPTDPGVDPDDPGQRDDPAIPFSAFDYVGVYDGEAHTIDTNALKAAWTAALGAVTVGYATASNGTYQSNAFALNDVGVASFWYKVTSANYADVMKPCKVAITNRCVTLTSGTKLDFEYDGKPHAYTNLTVTAGSFVAGEGISTSNWATVTVVVEGQVANTFDFEALDGTKLSNYDLTVVTGKIAVVKGDLPPGDDPDPTDPGVDPDDPGQREDPTIPFSAFDYVGMYDGAYHTIDTNALKAAWTAALGAVTVGYATASNGIYQSDAFLFKDSVVTSFWYKVASANYSDVVKPCKVAITNRCVTLTSGTKLDFEYDGKPHAYTNLTVTAGSFVAGEGISTSNWATVTVVVEGQVPNAFDYGPIAGTKLSNYAFTVVTGKIAVVQGDLPPGDDPDPVDPGVDPDDPAQREDPDVRFSAFDYVGMYDGEAHTVDTNALKAAWTAALGAVTVGYSTASNGAYQATAFAFKDAVVTSFWYKVTSANYADVVKPCKVVITNRCVTLTSGTKLDFVYDGQPYAYTNLSVTAGSFVAGEGIATSNWATVTTVDEGQVANTFDFEALDGTKLSNYAFTVVTGKIAVVQGDLPPGGDPDPVDPGVDPDDPAQREDPDVRFSAFDYVGMYDGEAHAIDTNALKAAWTAALGAVTVGYSTASNGAYQATAFAFKDVGVTSFWYKLTSANYSDVVKPCKVAITNRPVTVTSGTKLDFTYDGQPHAYTNLSVTAGSFVAGEGIATSNWATVTTVDEGQVANAFDFEALDGTKLSNYDLTIVTGKIAVVKGDLPPGDDPDPTDPTVDPDDPGQREDPTIPFSAFDYVGMYDGEAHTVDTNALKAAWTAALGAVTVGYSTASNGTYQSDAFLFKDAVVTSFWYKVMSANYGDVIKPCKVVITNRCVTLTSGSQQWTYDNNAHSNMTVAVGGDGFVAGEGVTTNGFATIMDVGSKPNAFSYAFQAGTLAENYAVTCVTGTLTVVTGTLPPGDDPDPLPPGVDPDDPGQRDDPTIPFSAFDYVGIYDGGAHTIDTNALKAAWTAALGAVTVGYSAASNGAYQTTAFAFKDSVVTSFWYKVTSANYADVVKPCKVVITNRCVTLTSGSQQWTYDNNAHSNMTVAVGGDGFVAGEGVTTNGFATIMDVGSKPNAFSYAFQAGTLAENYAVTCVTGTLTVVTGTLPPGGDPDPTDPGVDPDDPAQREDPDVRFSAFDYVGVYDGEAHTVDTNALKQVWTAALGAVTVGYSVASNGVYQATAFAFKDVGVTSFWYKVTSANYSDVVKPCKVAITNRCVTLTSGTKLDFVYDGKPHAYTNLSVTAGSFVAGEGIATSNWATVTTVAEGEVPNAFDYAPLAGTKLSNYDLTVVTGKIAVVKGDFPPGNDPDPLPPEVDPDDPGQREDPTIPFSAFDYVGMYDGEAHTVDTNALKTAYAAKLGAVTVGYSTASNGAYQATAFAFKDVGVTSFWYKVTSANYADVVKPCKMAITNRSVTVTSGTKTDFTYDGKPHAYTNLTVTAGSFVAGEGIATSNWATVTAIAEGQVPNTFDFEALDGTKLSNYALTVVTGKIAVVKGDFPPGNDPDPLPPEVDPDDPGQREDPMVLFSTFDYVGMYDGAYHTIDTNALRAAWTAALGAVTIGYSTASNGAYQATAFAFKDAVVTSFWYKVTSANYSDVVKPCKVAITNRCVTLTSGTKLDFEYDGKPHAFTNLTVTAGSFVAGEGIATSNWATVTAIAEGQVPNAFDYAPLAGTKLENYDLIVVTGKIAVVKGDLPPGDDPDPLPPGVDPDDPGQREDPTIPFSAFDYVGMYDGEAHTIDTNALKAAWTAALGAVTIGYSTASNGAYQATAFAFKDAVVTSFWYKVTSANYSDVVKPCKVAITNRCVTLTSGTKLDFEYDGKPHAFTNLTVTAGSFVAGEGIATSNWATVTAIAEGQVPNAFDYAPIEGTKLSNYDLTVVTGKIAVVSAPTATSVVFDAMGGKVDGKTVVTQQCSETYGTLPMAIRDGYRFNGWFADALSDKTQIVAGATLMTPELHFVFAHWSPDPSVCDVSIFKWEKMANGTVRILGFKNSNQQIRKLVFPDAIGGCAVTEIADQAFANSKSGMTDVMLPQFLTRIGNKAFLSVTTLKEVQFVSSRQVAAPTQSAALTIGSYAFSGCSALEELFLTTEVSALEDYAFANTRKLSKITILGQPVIGKMPFRSSGMDVGGVTIHLSPVLAGNQTYMDGLKQNLSNVTIRTDAVVTSITTSSIQLQSNKACLTVGMEQASQWGEIDLTRIKVSYRGSLLDPAIVLTPSAAVRNADGSVTLEVGLPSGSSGFVQTVFEK